ncbi:type III PLP-dependent enzyme domain-containing protein [Rhodococcus koreensis]|uniref:diaminopimelate decarboxylase n=1 Tax=Rhodococcus koreensis TaxID=99653 RepID=UPI0036DB2F53
MTLLDILPSLRGTTTPRLDPLVWPVTTHCHHGRITVGGVGLDEIADRFGVPTYVLDEESVGGGGKTFVHGLRDAEMLYRTAPLLPCGVARSVAERRLTVVVHSRRDVALARQGGLDPDSIVLVVDAADSRSHSEVPPWPGGVGRIVVGAGVRIDTVAAPGPESGRQKTIVGVRDTCCAGATIRRVVAAPGLDLIGIRCDCVPTVGDIREQVLTAVAVMCDANREHRVLCTELHLGIAGGATDIVGSSDLADAIADAVEDACIRNRFPRPRLSVDAGRSVTARAAVNVCRVHHFERTPGGPVVVLDSGAGSVVAVTTGELVAAAVANRHPSGPAEEFSIMRCGSMIGAPRCSGVVLAQDVRPGDVVALVSRDGSDLVGSAAAVSVAHGRMHEPTTG